MYGCERLLGITRSYEVRGLIEDSTGAPCPCKTGMGCPLGIKPPAPALEFLEQVLTAVGASRVSAEDIVA